MHARACDVEFRFSILFDYYSSCNRVLIAILVYLDDILLTDMNTGFVDPDNNQPALYAARENADVDGCLVDPEMFCRHFILLRLRHSVSEIALDHIAELFNDVLSSVDSGVRVLLSESADTDVPRTKVTGLKRSLQQTIDAVGQVSSVFRRRQFIARHISPTVRIQLCSVFTCFELSLIFAYVLCCCIYVFNQCVCMLVHC